MKRLLAILAVSGVAALAAGQSVKPVTGWISDSHCGAAHMGSGAACVKKCIAGGEKPVFVDDEKKQVWAIDNPDSVANYYGEHISVTGKTDEDAKTIHIDKAVKAE